MIRCLVFDFDGTLVDSNPIKRQSFFDAVADYDPDGAVVREVLDALAGADRFDVMQEVARRLQADGRLPDPPRIDVWAERLADAYTRRCEEAVAKCDEIPGATAALEAFGERDLPCYVDSATPQDPLRRVISLRGWERFFRGCFGRPADKLEILRGIAMLAGVRPDEMALVGDSEDDRFAAAEFGCRFIAVVRPGPDRFTGTPELRLPDLLELPAVIERLDAERA